ncbi:TPA: lytic transglycosylase domain-containing protein [Escherichia coli]|nr:lytic transglycosylase domain-containing protein [Escherichia coli]
MAGSFDFTITADDRAGEQLGKAASAAESLAEKVDDARKKMAEASDAIRGLNGGLSEATGAESQKNADTLTACFERLSVLGKDTARHFGDILPPLRNIGALSSGLTGVLGKYGLAGLAGAAGGMAVKAVVSNLYDASKAAYSLDVNARNAGMSVSAFSRFAGVFRLMGLSAEQAQSETGALFTKLNDALNTRSPEVAGILNQFGVKLAENSDHTVNLEKSTQNLIDAFGRLNGSSQKVVADALGLSDAQLAMLRGTKSLNAALAESDRLKLTMPDSLNAKLVQANSNLNRLSAAWDGFTGRLQSTVLGSDAVTKFTESTTESMTLLSRLMDGDSSRSTITGLALKIADNSLLPGGGVIKSMIQGEAGQRSDRLNALTATLKDDLAAALSAPPGGILLRSPPQKNGAGGNDISPELRAHFAALEKQYNLPENTLYGLAMTESSGRADAIGPLTRYGTAKGMFQFIDPTAREFGLSGMDVFNPYRASEAAARKMAGLMTRYGGDMQQAFQAYNWGEGNMSAWLRGQKGMPQETRAYAPKVFSYMSQVSGGSIITPQSGSTGADVRDEISRGFSENKIRLDINVTNTSTGQTTRRTVKGGAVATAMEL